MNCEFTMTYFEIPHLRLRKPTT